ncbi:hypothetical protein LIS82_27385 (plasmid) [Cytobacillus solani]|uniref:hypothetical protein n=1 Tax=Cytobacillus solani TaxID=1637975 RepID=UPI00207A61C0|nr:hypothetical protein [Cytobacillus solani]USK57704.1 hypothetical protein LIS82_27385 [Cytobacillus solani]
MSIKDNEKPIYDSFNMNVYESKKEDDYNILPYEIGEKVQIHTSVTEDEDPESFYYLKEWIGKQGVIKEVIRKPCLQYKVIFKEKEIYLYHNEISL